MSKSDEALELEQIFETLKGIEKRLGEIESTTKDESRAIFLSHRHDAMQKLARMVRGAITDEKKEEN